MLKKIRIVLAAIMFIGVTLLFVGIGHEWWGWMAKIQFLPSLLAMNVVAVAALCVLTLVFGRIYCSVICPMGIWQDIVNQISSLRKGKKRRFSFSPEKKWLRNGILAAYIICLIAGLQAVIALLAPYSAWGRIVGSIFHPHGVIVPVIAGVTCLVVTVLAWLGGRTYCNTICPVGTTLSWIARFSIFRPMIDESKCITACSANVCKSLLHVDLTLNDADRALIDVISTILLSISLNKSLSSVYGKRFREAVTADCYDTELYVGCVKKFL